MDSATQLLQEMNNLGLVYCYLLNPEQENNIQNEHTDQEDPLVENDYLDRPITETDVLYAIRNLKTGKSPGIDGFTIQYPVFQVLRGRYSSFFHKFIQFLFWACLLPFRMVKIDLMSNSLERKY